MKQPRYLGTIETLTVAAFALLMALSPLGEAAFAALEPQYREYALILWDIIIVVISGIVFTVGWLVFASDRNWTIALIATFFLGAGLFNALHLFNLISSVSTRAAFSQDVAALSLWARVFAALGLLVTANVSVHRKISLSMRFILLGSVLAVVAGLILFTASPVYTDFLMAIFVDGTSVELRPEIGVVLFGIYAAAIVAFTNKTRRKPQAWLGKLLMACYLLALAELGLLLTEGAPTLGIQLFYVVSAVGYTYVYRAVFLYSIQWPIEQMNEWRERLRTSQRELAVTKLAVDGSGYYIFEFDSNGRISYVSRNACRRMGFERDELVGMDFRDISNQQHPDLFLPEEARRENGGAPQRFELELNTKGGQTFPVAISTTYTREDDERHFYAIMEDISDRKAFEAKLAENARQLRRVIDSIPFYVSILTPDGRYIDSNRAVVDGLEDIEELSNMSVAEFLGPLLENDNAEEMLTDAFLQARSGKATSLELQIGKQPNAQYIDFVVAPVRDDSGEVVSLVNTSSDITDRLMNQEELKLASTVFDHSAEAILIADENMRTLSANRAFSTITGFDEQEILGRVAPLLTEGKHLDAMHESLDRQGNWSGEVEWTKKNGDIGYEWLTLTKVFDKDHAVRNYIVIFSDITEKKRTEEHIQYLAYYDPLTGLPNRVLLEDRVNQAIAQARRTHQKVGLIFLDLDHFKTINDSLGHHHGDQLLTEVASRLEHNVRESDTVARLGGDEFVIVLPGIEDAHSTSAIAQKLLGEVQNPYLLDGVELRVTISVGICMYPDDGVDFSRLIMNADAAMYHAKENGRNNVQVFVDEMGRRAAELLDMETRLRRALDREEFILCYQPQVDIHSGAVVSFEALVRWNDPDLGVVPPAEFIPVAESRGLITEIDGFVLREACKQNRQWQAAGLPGLPVAVNVSAKQFRDAKFVLSVKEALLDAGLEPQYLELEVTETVVMHDAEEVISTLEELRQLGVKLTIDDFGTGYSSLSYLKRFPIEKIKIDISFIRDIPGDREDFSIVRAIVGLSQQLNLKVLAEGVETSSQLEALRSIRCDEYQGFYFSRPVSADDMEKLLRGGTNVPAGSENVLALRGSQPSG